MSLKSLTLPEDLATWGSWLDSLLFDSALLETILELEVLAGEQLDQGNRLDEIVTNEQVDSIARSGFASVEPSVSRQILRQPIVLLELQEIVFLQGGPFWEEKIDRLSNSASHQSLKLPDSSIGLEATSEHDSTSVSNNQSTRRSDSAASSIFSRRVVLALITSAAVLMFAFVYINRPPPKTPWGLAKVNEIPLDANQAETKRQLLVLAGAWRNKTPKSTNALANRLRVYIDGCQDVIDSPLTQLSAANRVITRDACKQCIQEFSEHLSELEQGTAFEEVQQMADESIKSLVAALETMST